MDDEHAIRALFAAGEQELLTDLGSALLGEGLGFGVEDPGRARRFAQKWLEQRWERIREIVCDDAELKATLRGEHADHMLEVAMIADALAALAGKPAASVLAVIVLRRGADAVCGGAI